MKARITPRFTSEKRVYIHGEMITKTTLLAAVLAFALPKSTFCRTLHPVQGEHLAIAEIPAISSQTSLAPSLLFSKPSSPEVLLNNNANPEKYAVVHGTVQTEDEGDPVSSFYLDVYKLLPDGRRELARTGRQVGNTFRVYLERAHTHYLQIDLWGYGRTELEVTALQLQQAEGPLQLVMMLKKTAPIAPPAPVPATAPDGELLPAIQTIILVDEEIPPPAEAMTSDRLTEEPMEKMAPDLKQRAFQLKETASLYYNLGDTTRIMARISAGAAVEVLERTTPDWWLVGYHDMVGWVAVGALK